MSGWWPSLSAMSATALTKAIASLKFLNLKVRRIAFPRPSGGTPPSHGTHRRDARSSIGEYVPPPKQCLPLEFHHVRPPAGRLVPARRPPPRLTNPLPLA